MLLGLNRAGAGGERPRGDAGRSDAGNRAEAIGEQLRCLVCQNESVEQSDADLAKDLRRIIRQRVSTGDSDRQVTEWMVARYGNFIRLRPPVDGQTVFARRAGYRLGDSGWSSGDRMASAGACARTSIACRTAACLADLLE